MARTIGADLFDGDLFEEVAVGARLDRFVQVFFLVAHRKHQHFGGGKGAPDLAGRFDARQARHAHVHQDHIRGQLVRLGHRLLAVGGLSHHFDIRAGRQHDGEAASEQCLVVGHKYSHERPARRSRCLICRAHHVVAPARRPPALSPHMIEKITVLSGFSLLVQSARGHGLGRKTRHPVRSRGRAVAAPLGALAGTGCIRRCVRSCAEPVCELRPRWLTWSLPPHSPAVAVGGPVAAAKRPAPPALHLSSSPSRADSRPVDGQGLLLSRTMLGNHGLPYVGRFACGWRRLATTDPPGSRGLRLVCGGAVRRSARRRRCWSIVVHTFAPTRLGPSRPVGGALSLPVLASLRTFAPFVRLRSV